MTRFGRAMKSHPRHRLVALSLSLLSALVPVRAGDTVEVPLRSPAFQDADSDGTAARTSPATPWTRPSNPEIESKFIVNSVHC